MISYNIISTGSKGNAVVIGRDILIDCGVPFRALKDVYMELRLVLLTHCHSDHFNRQTIKRLAQERPMLRWGCCEWLVAPLIECGVEKRSIDLYECERDYHYGGNVVEKITPFELTHNAINCGYKIVYGDGSLILYATDTNSMSGVEARNYDLYLLEANYSEEEITERIRDKQGRGEYCYEWDVLRNHLSKEEADDWLYQNMGNNSRYMYLHGHEDEKSKALSTA